MSFNKAFKLTIGHEGGYTTDPDDRGNWTSGVIGEGHLKGTKYGISAMSYPDLNIGGLTVDQAKEIYKQDFWDKMKADEVDLDIGIELFDTAVNTGIGKATRIFQEALNLSNRNEKDYSNIIVDGQIGAKTIGAYQANRNKKLLYNIMNILQGEHYINLMRRKEMFEKYIGWFNRVDIIKSYG